LQKKLCSRKGNEEYFIFWSISIRTSLHSQHLVHRNPWQKILYLGQRRKKAPRDLTSRGQCPSFDDQSTFLQTTRKREWENRQKKLWTPAKIRSPTSKKRKQRMPLINKGANASKVLASKRHRPLQSASKAVDIVDELPKK